MIRLAFALFSVCFFACVEKSKNAIPESLCLEGTNSASTTSTPTKVVVILGSSIGAGVGASKYENSWIGIYAKNNPSTKIFNLAKGGYTSSQILPTGTVIPNNRPTIDTLRNVTAALKLNPTHLIIVMATNDVAMGYPLSELFSNLKAVYTSAYKNKIQSIFVATSVPRKSDINTMLKYRFQRDSTFVYFCNHTINFYDTLLDSTGYYKPELTQDWLHPNDKGQILLYNEFIKSFK